MKSSGFTLIELVMTMMIVGILAVAAIPRLLDRQIFESKGFYDETLAALRYAQKSAIAQRRTVCVAFTSTTVTLTIASVAGASACPADTNLAGPNAVSPFSVAARSGVSFFTTPNNFYFDAQGQASIGQSNIQVPGAAGSITIEQATGYVHP